MMDAQFSLAWYDTKTDWQIGRCAIDVTADEVRKVYGMGPDDYPGDCLLVGSEHLEWLKPLTVGVDILLHRYEYYIEITSPSIVDRIYTHVRTRHLTWDEVLERLTQS